MIILVINFTSSHHLIGKIELLHFWKVLIITVDEYTKNTCAKTSYRHYFRYPPPPLDKQIVSHTFTAWLANEFVHVLIVIHMWRWKWHQWMLFGCLIDLAHHFMAPHQLPPFNPIGVFVVSAMPVKTLGNSASYPFNSWCIVVTFMLQHLNNR